MADSSSGLATTPPALAAKYQRAFALGKRGATELATARQLLLECVQGDPTNLIFVDTFLQLLQRATPAGGRFQGVWDRVAFERALRSGDSEQVIQRGLRLLTVRPADALVLCGLGASMQALGHRDVALRYWRAADHAQPGAPVIQRRCAHAFQKMGLFGEARHCWQRLGDLVPGDRETLDALNLLTQPPALSANHTVAETRAATLDAREVESEVESEGVLIECERMCQAGDLASAINLLMQTRQTSPGDFRIAEKLEDLELDVVRQRLQTAQRQVDGAEAAPAAASGSSDQASPMKWQFEQHQRLIADLQADLVRREIDVYATRAARYPQDHSWKWKLALCLQQAGNYGEAGRVLGEISAGEVPAVRFHLLWGECLQHQCQFESALAQYELAVASIADDRCPGPFEALALYRAGVLAFQLGGVSKAHGHLRTLAAASPNYKDTEQHLDKIDAIRHKEGF